MDSGVHWTKATAGPEGRLSLKLLAEALQREQLRPPEALGSQYRILPSWSSWMLMPPSQSCLLTGIASSVYSPSSTLIADAVKPIW